MASMEGLLSLLGNETFDSFYSDNDFEPDFDDPSRLLYRHTPSDIEHAQGVPETQAGIIEAIGGAECSDWNKDHYLLLSVHKARYQLESTAEIGIFQWLVLPLNRRIEGSS